MFLPVPIFFTDLELNFPDQLSHSFPTSRWHQSALSRVPRIGPSRGGARNRFAVRPIRPRTSMCLGTDVYCGVSIACVEGSFTVFVDSDGVCFDALFVCQV